MNTPVEVFLDQGEMQIFDEVKRTAVAFLECKHAQLDTVMPAHVEQREIRWRLADTLQKQCADACLELLNEIIRSTFAESCNQRFPAGKAYDYYKIWCIDLLRETMNTYTAHPKALGYGRVCAPDADDVVAFKKRIQAYLQGRWNPSHPDEKPQAELNRRIAELIGSHNIFWLPEATIFGLRLRKRDDFIAWLATAPDDLDSLVSTCGALERKACISVAAATQTEEKIKRTALRLINPAMDFIKESTELRKGNLTLTLLCGLIIQVTVQYRPDQLDKSKSSLSPYFAHEAKLVFQIMFQLDPHDWRCFADGLIAMIEAPRTFARWNCPPEHKAVKAKLRCMAELATGPVKFPVERAHLLARLRDPEVGREEIITLTSQYLAQLYDNSEPSDRLHQQMNTLTLGWISDLDGWLANVHPRESKHWLQTTADAEFEKLLAEETAAATKLEQEMARWRDSWNEHQSETANVNDDPADTTPSVAQPLRLAYVENLGSEFWRTQDLSCPRFELADTLDRYLLDKTIETVVPASSIARAIEHCVFEMTPEQRNLLPMERIANEPWRKLKRGGQRIYILEKQGEYFVHLMKRKDWVIPASQEARY